MNARERYTCTIARDADGAVEAIAVERVDLSGEERKTQLNGTKAPLIVGALHGILRAGGVSAREWAGRRPIELTQVPGAHAELLLRAVGPLRRADRLDEVAAGVGEMSREEASYWHAKADRTRGLRVLRLMLSDDARRR